MDKWERIRDSLRIGADEPLVVYKKTWRERLHSLRPWKSWTTKFVWEHGFDESRALTRIPDRWRASIWKRKP